MVLKGTTTACISSCSSSSLSKTINTSERKVSTSKPPGSEPARLGVIKQSVRDRKFSQNVADFVSKSRRTSTQKVYDAKWTTYTSWCHRKKVNPVSAPLTVIADFLIYRFSEKKKGKRKVQGVQPFPDPKRKRKPTNLNKHKSNKRTKSTKVSFLFPKRGNRNTKRTEKHKNKMTHGKTYNKSPRRINHKATKSKTNTGITAPERSVVE